MTADMHRLERAARLSLGDFHDATQGLAPRRALRFSIGAVILLAIVAALTIGAIALS